MYDSIVCHTHYIILLVSNDFSETANPERAWNPANNEAKECEQVRSVSNVPDQRVNERDKSAIDRE